MKHWWSTLFLISLFFSGCSIPFWGDKTAKAPILEEVKKPPSKKVVISELDIMDRPYTIIGDVNASVSQLTPFGTPLKELANEQLQLEATKIGADGVIFIRYKTLPKTWTRWSGMEAKGKAVVFKYY